FADDRMIDDAHELLAREWSLFIEQRFGHGDLADVVEQTRGANSLRGFNWQPNVQRERAREIADALRMSARVAVLRFESQRERADDVLRLFEIAVIVLDAQQRLNARDQLETIERIAEEIVGAVDDRRLTQLRVAMRRQHDHRQKFVTRIEPQ